MLLDKTPLYPQRGSNTQPSERRVDALTTAPWQIISFGFVKWRVECLRSIFWYSNLHNTPDRFRTCCQKNHMWPGRDLNTQPSELESDALPLRHQACCLLKKLLQYYTWNFIAFITWSYDHHQGQKTQKTLIFDFLQRSLDQNARFFHFRDLKIRILIGHN